MTNVNPDNQNFPEDDLNQDLEPDNDTAGLPLRGLAMVLIAVAVLLGLGGLYALTQSGNNSGTTAGDAGNAENATETVMSQTQQPAPENSEPISRPEEQPGEGDGDRRDGQSPAPGDDTNAGGANAGNADAPVTINVLNNSTIGGLAERIHGDLAADGQRVGQHGNLPGEVATVSETTVFFKPGDEAGERAARELAQRVAEQNGVPASAEPYIDGLPAEVTGDGQIVLVLMGEVTV